MRDGERDTNLSGCWIKNKNSKISSILLHSQKLCRKFNILPLKIVTKSTEYQGINLMINK